MEITLRSRIINDEYTDYVNEAFDIQFRDENVTTIDCNLTGTRTFDWNIGVVYGGSGSGKTTILREFFKQDIAEPKFDDKLALISNFDWMTPNQAAQLLSSMGLASVPAWLRPFKTLSNGEQYRAKLAYIVGRAQPGELVLVDEYTSVVDRDVAKAMSNALQKYVRRNDKRIVLASCHFDIMEWLKPDWIYSPQKGRLEKKSHGQNKELNFRYFDVDMKLGTYSNTIII